MNREINDLHNSSGILKEPHSVFVLDNDSSNLSQLTILLESRGIKVRSYDRADGLLADHPPACPSCLILENDLGDGIQGLEIHRQLLEAGWHVPTLFLTTCRDLRAVVKAMKNGAKNYFTKPFESDELIKAVFDALEQSRECIRLRERASHVRKLFSNLTGREREIVKLVVAGHMNKEIASHLKLALVTVKVHRGRAMRKLGVTNAVELTRIVSLAQTKPDDTPCLICGVAG